MPLYQNQIDTASSIIDSYRNGKPHVLLYAQMQSGKTGVFMLVAAEMKRMNYINNFVVMCSSGDKELSHQLKNPDSFWRDYRKYLRDKFHFESDEAEAICEEVKKNFTCICGIDIKKNGKNYKNTLFIIDESHHGQSIGQTLDGFFKRSSLQADGTPCLNGNIIMTVSATAFSEMIDNEDFKQNKEVVTLKPSDDYFGIQQIFQNNLISPFVKEDLPKHLDELKENNTIGYFRSRNKVDVYKEFIQKLCHDKQIELIVYDQNFKQTLDDIIEEKKSMGKPLCVFLIGRIAMGKRLPGKSHTQWVIESGVSKLDTCLQGLLGRICGYKSSGSGPHIKVYIDKKSIQMIQDSKYIDSVCHGLYGNFANSMNTKKSKVKKNRKLFPTIPEHFKIPVSSENCDLDATDEKSFIRDFLKSEEFMSESKNALCFPDAIGKLKVDISNPSNIHISDINCDSYKDLQDKLDSLHRDNELFINLGSGCGFENVDKDIVRVFTKNKLTRNSTHFEFYVLFRTDKEPDSRIFKYKNATTNGKEIFRHHNNDGTVIHQNGCVPFGIKPESARDVGVMCTQITHVLGLRKDSELIVPSCISSIQNEVSTNGIFVNDLVYKALLPNGSIYNTVKNDFNKEIKLTHMRGRKPKDLPHWCKARLSSISWN